MNNTYQTPRLLQHKGLTIPGFLYGTAWKADQTEQLTRLALATGFLGIDTANQRRHYFEAGVGSALRQALAEDRLQRSDLFLQTKFTYVSSQDHRPPYDANADYGTQVQQSFKSSLEHLGTSYIDSYLLHGPATHLELSDDDRQVWRTMESLQKSGAIRLLGISNINLGQLQSLFEEAEIKPAFVQNRCYARAKWDLSIREFCRNNDIIYQGFSLLTANSEALKHPDLARISIRHHCSIAQLVFRFAIQTGMMPITGTCNADHMRADLAIYDLELSDSDMLTIENITG
ncbi:MAG: aldo/keto reductase [Methylococcaceae bacterium]|nr:aldo/keto reductase [Methylococcaceae bacterium]